MTRRHIGFQIHFALNKSLHKNVSTNHDSNEIEMKLITHNERLFRWSQQFMALLHFHFVGKRFISYHLLIVKLYPSNVPALQTAQNSNEVHGWRASPLKALCVYCRFFFHEKNNDSSFNRSLQYRNMRESILVLKNAPIRFYRCIRNQWFEYVNWNERQ